MQAWWSVWVGGGCGCGMVVAVGLQCWLRLRIQIGRQGSGGCSGCKPTGGMRVGRKVVRENMGWVTMPQLHDCEHSSDVSSILLGTHDGVCVKICAELIGSYSFLCERLLGTPFYPGDGIVLHCGGNPVSRIACTACDPT